MLPAASSEKSSKKALHKQVCFLKTKNNGMLERKKKKGKTLHGAI